MISPSESWSNLQSEAGLIVRLMEGKGGREFKAAEREGVKGTLICVD